MSVTSALFSICVTCDGELLTKREKEEGLCARHLAGALSAKSHTRTADEESVKRRERRHAR